MKLETPPSRRWPLFAGIALGLIIAGLVLVLHDRYSSTSGGGASGGILPECQGHFRELVIQYVPSAADIVTTAYRQFLPQLPADVTVYVACPDRPAFDDLRARVGPTACTLTPVLTHHPMTTWSRDRWLVLGPPGAGAGTPGAPGAGAAVPRRSWFSKPPPTTTLLCSRVEENSEAWPQRAGDERIGQDLALTLKGVACRVTDYRFDGGDFMADEDTVFVTTRVSLANIQHTVQDRDDLARQLQALLHKRVVLLDNAPDHHAAMYMMCIGNRTMLVADPAWGKRLVDQADLAPGSQPGSASSLPSPASALAPSTQPTTASSFPNLKLDGLNSGSSRSTSNLKLLCPPEGPDFSASTQAHYDAVAQQCAALGYGIIRMPVVPGLEGRRVLTYLNALIDVQNGHRRVYMPVYRGRAATALNAAATKVWSDQGFEVIPIDCTDTYIHFGCLHCLVNVLRRD